MTPTSRMTRRSPLLVQPAIAALVRELFTRAVLVTPNLDETALLVGRPIENAQDMEAAAQELLTKGAQAVLIKGGHLPGDTVIDLLMTAGGETHWMQAPRIHSANTHGTGCTLSSAIAAGLALGQPLLEAVESARAYIRAALQAGANVKTGGGSGPLNHSHAPVAMWLRPLHVGQGG